MKKLLALLFCLVMLIATVLPVSAAGLDLSTVEYEGKTYYNLGGKDDYFKAARYGIDNRLSAVPVLIDYSKFPDYQSNNIWYCNVTNFDYTCDGLYFTYLQYSPSTVCMTGYHHDFENNLEYGDIEISYIDSVDELNKADAMLDAELKKVASYKKADKIRYIAEYICKHVDAGFQKMPDGGYDIINGVYDLMTGVRTNVVCSSFAFLFQRFMERAGYKSYIATNDNHAWNVVELDGKWYGVDCTFADNGSALNPDYLLMGMDRLQQYVLSNENVFTELEKEKGCRFAEIGYGATPTTTTTTTTATTTTTETTVFTTTSATTTATTTTIKADTTTSASVDDVTTSTNKGDQTTDGSSTTDTSAADVTVTDGSSTTTATIDRPVVTVDVSQQAEVAVQVFEQAVQNNEAVVLKAQTYEWHFEADKLTNVNTVSSLNTAIQVGEEVAQEDQTALKEINKDESFFPFSFAHHGDLPGEAKISIHVDESFAEKAVDIYSVNANGEAVLEGSGTVTADGELVFYTNHCSLWFIKEAKAEQATTSNLLPLILCVSAVVILAGAVGIWWILRKKRA